MRVLIAYDGSKSSEAALDDLVRSGLPGSGEALIVSVAEVWLPPVAEKATVNGDTGIHLDPESERRLREHEARSRQAVEEAHTLAKHGMQRFSRFFPDWTVTSEANYGSPAWEILSRADSFQPDLIVVGSHGRSAVSRFFLGSISEKILTEARCSVRIARGRIEVDPTPARIMAGFDGSAGAAAAIETIASRTWPKGSEARLVAAANPMTPSAIGRFIPPVVDVVEEVNDAERAWLENLADEFLEKLRGRGLTADLHIHSGNPKVLLVDEAQRWNADCIFVGATALGGRVERFLLGSTSAAVASRAHCSVEVVRKPTG